MRSSHGWAEISAARKREIIEGIVSGSTTRGPAHAEIDISDRCNVGCYFCNAQDVRTKDQISLEHLVRLVDELASGGLRSVRLSGGGDPLAHPAAVQFLDHLYARGIIVDNLTTNGALLGREVAHRLVEHRAREVIFSLNAADEHDYARMMRTDPGVFHRVLENIKALRRTRSQSPYPAVVVQFLLDQRNYSQLAEMYDLGRTLEPDRIAVAAVLEIPLNRIGPDMLLKSEHAEALRPHLREVVSRDRDARLLQIDFPFQAWNVVLAEVRAEVGYPAGENPFPMAASFQEKNGQCFFGWYTATIKGDGSIYPCCLLMLPNYKPLGNAVNGRFLDQWNGPTFQRLRREQREILLAGESAHFDPRRHHVIARQCVEYGACWLKNIYFRADQDFYAELGAALAAERQRTRWRREAAELFRSIRSLLGQLRYRPRVTRAGKGL